jgi:predicted nucleic acid-binding protein
MMFWDSSALIPLFVEEPHSKNLLRLAKKDREMIVWWGSSLECRSAFARLRRESKITSVQEDRIIEQLTSLSGAWSEILPSESVRQTAARLLRLHPLKTADSLQLAAALVWSGDQMRKGGFVCLDQRLGEAARKEGLVVVPESEPAES